MDENPKKSKTSGIIKRKTSVSRSSQESKDVLQTQSDTIADKYPAKRNIVTFAPKDTNIPCDVNREPSCLANIEQNNDEFVLKENRNNQLHSSNTHLSQSNTSNKSMNKFTQTFFKSMMNLSNRRFVEIINTSVNHDNNSLVFC